MMIRKMAFLAVSCLALAGCLLGSPKNNQQTDTQQTGLLQNRDDKVEALLKRMTLEQKVAQMIQAEIKFVTPEDLRQYGLGSILNGGGSFPNNDKHASVDDWLALADAYYQASVDSSAGSAGIPVIWGTDAVHGHNNVVGATLFPHNIGLGAANDPALIKRIAQATAREVAATGIDWLFAPTVAVARDDRWGRTYESYSDQPGIVVDYASNFVQGIQGENMVATAKHFIGDGATYRGIDQGDARLAERELLAEHGGGYVSAIDAGVMTVMASFNSWNGEKVHGNKFLLTDVLKERMGFEGFVVSDWNGVGQVAGCNNETCPQSINAGVDMIMVPEDWKVFLRNAVQQVRDGVIAETRIDDAVRRILRVKFRVGLMDRVPPSQRPWAKKPGIVGHPDHRAVARQAVRKSLVLLKNNGQLLPLNNGATVMVAGVADDIGRQSGGWTISWQGTGNSNDDFPGATSIYEGIRQAVEAGGGNAYLSRQGQYSERPDVAIVVFGESPYAEGQGDLETLAFDPSYKDDLKLLRRLKSEGIPVVAVFLTGRPMWVNAEMNASDAFVVAWLPGSEGGGVADLLFRDDAGNVRYDFTGRLSFDWPAAELNAGDRGLPVADTLFPYGYGLSVQDQVLVADNLGEQRIGGDNSLDKVIFSRGTKKPWKPYLGDASDWAKRYTGGYLQSQYRELAVAAVDIVVQEDGRQLTWSGNGQRATQFYWQTDASVDLLALRDAGAALSAMVRVDSAPEGEVMLRMDCGYPCSGAVNITEALRGAPAEKWIRITVDLECFQASGANLAKIDTPFLLSTDRPLSLVLSEVSITTEFSPESRITCPMPVDQISNNPS